MPQDVPHAQPNDLDARRPRTVAWRLPMTDGGAGATAAMVMLSGLKAKKVPISDGMRFGIIGGATALGVVCGILESQQLNGYRHRVDEKIGRLEQELHSSQAFSNWQAGIDRQREMAAATAGSSRT